MVWFRVDDTLPTHHRVIQAGNAAMGLWVRCGAWSMGQLTDGHIPIAVARMFGTPEEAQALVNCGLWEDADDGYQFHRWAEDASGAPRQPTKAEIDLKRKTDRERKQQYAANARAALERRRAVQTPDGVAEDSARNPAGTPPESGNSSVNPDPTRPDPNFTSPTSDEVGEARKRTPRQRGSRIPDQFIVTTDMRTWAHTQTPGLDINRSTEKFVNYWRAKTGKDATKLDWAATWRNWILTDQERRTTHHPQRPTKDDRAAATIRLGAEVQAALEAAPPTDAYLDLKELPA